MQHNLVFLVLTAPSVVKQLLHDSIAFTSWAIKHHMKTDNNTCESVSMSQLQTNKKFSLWWYITKIWFAFHPWLCYTTYACILFLSGVFENIIAANNFSWFILIKESTAIIKKNTQSKKYGFHVKHLFLGIS